MKPILLLDNTNHIIREFDSYKQANQFRMMNNRPDWSIASRKLFWNGAYNYKTLEVMYDSKKRPHKIVIYKAISSNYNRISITAIDLDVSTYINK